MCVYNVNKGAGNLENINAIVSENFKRLREEKN
jgi:hypothetical protein